MLGWLAAAALPWLINLWIRRRHVDAPWAAVELLQAAVRASSRRLRRREWLLAALRSAVLLLVAVAAARPEVRTAATAGDERTHHVLILDQSFSMATRGGDSSRWERAQERAREIVENAPAGDAFTVIGWSATAEDALGRPAFDAAGTLAAIAALEPLDTVADLAAAVSAAESAVTAAHHEFPDLRRTRVVVISDFAANTWAVALPPRTPATASGVTRDAAVVRDAAAVRAAWTKLASGSEIVLENVDDGVRDNLAIVEAALEPPRPLIDQPFAVVVQVRSFGQQTTSSVAVELLHNGAPLARQSAPLAPDGDATLRFDARAVERGSHVFEARIVDALDALTVDNRRWIVTEPALVRSALCIADDPAAAVDVARALNPRSTSRGGESPPPDAIAVESISTAGLESADLAAFDALFLCNVADLTAREQRLLAEYVAGGGGLAVILGDRVRPASYNAFFAAAGDGRDKFGPLLPATVADESVAGDWRFDPLDYRHPIAAPFADHARAGLLAVRVSRYFPLHLGGGDAGAAPSTALALTSNDPALVVGDFCHGRVAVLTTDPALRNRSEPWSSLAVSPSFVPLVRELFAHLTADRHVRRFNRLVGEPLELPAGQGALVAGRLSWTDPRGVRSTVPPATTRQGVYSVAAEHDERGAEPATALAFNVDPAESDLAAVDPAELALSAPAANVTVPGQIAGGAGAVSLAQYLIAAAVALSLVELTFAWFSGRGRT